MISTERGMLLRIVFFWMVFAVVGVFLSPHSWGTRALAFSQAILYLPVIIFMANMPQLRDLFSSLGTGRRALFLSVSGLIIIGQIASDNRKLYPFLQWRMYCSSKPTDSYVEYIAFHASGKQAHFPFSEVAPTTSSRDFMERFGDRVKKIADPANPTPEEAVRLAHFGEEMAKLVGVYNTHHASDSIRRVAVSVRRIPVSSYHEKGSVQQLPVIEVRVP